MVEPIPDKTALEVPERPFSAYIFDCDGTLVDSMPVHFKAWTTALAMCEAAFQFSEDEFYAYAGMKEQEVIAILNKEHDTTLDPEAVVALKDSMMEGLLTELRSIQPVADFARTVCGQVPTAVVSGSPRAIVDLCLEKTGLSGWFDHIITPVDVAPGRGKPAPDMFVLAAGRMGVNPQNCLVFEDGQSGIVGAREAGMTTVFVSRATR